MASYINFEKRKYINFCRKRAKDFVLENIILFKERTMTETRNTIFSYASHVTFFFLKKKRRQNDITIPLLKKFRSPEQNV